jgi:uncharacterized repeat protein (TIGR03803 family)
MPSHGQSAASRFDINLTAGSVTLVLLVLIATMILAVPLAQAQTFTVIHTFTGGADGGSPEGGLTMDAAGNLYGTTAGYEEPCGSQCGTVFEMKPTGQGWVLAPLYRFTGGSDGASPQAAVVFGPDGALYGTAVYGGTSCPSTQYGCGTVFRLTPQPRACNSVLCPWVQTVLYRFVGGANDGAFPLSQVTFDTAGNLYGTTYSGGVYTTNCDYGDNWCGTIFKLTHSNGGWTESVPYFFTGANDGANPIAGLTADAAGNFYGAAELNGVGGGGTIFELTPYGSGWAENTLLSFVSSSGGGYFPRGQLIFDPAGNLYGTTEFGGEYPNEGGTVFEMSVSGGGWTITGGYSLPGSTEHGGPLAGLVRDSAGNLYGTAFQLGSNNVGLVFKLTPSNGGWTYTLLHEFSVGDGGDFPVGGLVLDAQGNLYGTAGGGGAYGWGVVWEITP